MADTQHDSTAPTEAPDTVPENAPKTIATPEGDNEYLPDQPLPGNPSDITIPRGNEPHPSQPIRPAQP